VTAAALAMARPCDGCAERQTCRSPCAALEAAVGPPPTSTYREYGSVALMEGWASFAATPAFDTVDDEPLRWPGFVKEKRPHLRAGLARLPRIQRLIAKRFFGGKTRTQLGRELGMSRNTVARRLTTALTTLRSDLSQSIMENRKEGSMVRTSTTPPPPPVCAHPGCSKSVSSKRPSSPALAPYCEAHRRLRARSLRDAAQTPAPDPDRDAARALAEHFSSEAEALYIDVTPSLAAALLERNSNNRPLLGDRIDVYARDMASGDWRANNQGIALGADGRLYDGQHRLCAVIRSGCTVRMLVARGLSPDSRSTIDQGRMRSLGDLLRLLDGESRGACIVSWLHAIRRLTDKRATAPSHAMVRRQLAHYEPSVRWFLDNGPRAKPYARAAIVGALVYAHRAAGPAVEAFTRGYVSGANLPADSPILALRAYVTGRMHLDFHHQRVIPLKALRCVLAEIRGERLERVPPSEDGFEYFRKLNEALDRSPCAVAA